MNIDLQTLLFRHCQYWFGHAICFRILVTLEGVVYEAFEMISFFMSGSPPAFVPFVFYSILFMSSISPPEGVPQNELSTQVSSHVSSSQGHTYPCIDICSLGSDMLHLFCSFETNAHDVCRF